LGGSLQQAAIPSDGDNIVCLLKMNAAMNAIPAGGAGGGFIMRVDGQ
jgi:hypothetical protein